MSCALAGGRAATAPFPRQPGSAIASRTVAVATVADGANASGMVIEQGPGGGAAVLTPMGSASVSRTGTARRKRRNASRSLSLQCNEVGAGFGH